MRPFYRKTTPKVRDGKVQRKNRWSRTPNCYNTPQPRPLVHRRKPGTLANLCPQWLKVHGILLLKQIGEPCDRAADDRVVRRLAEWTIRAFQLTHILLHELGHHHDRMTTRRQLDSCRGEPYAEQYSLRYSCQVWDAFVTEFGLP